MPSRWLGKPNFNGGTMRRVSRISVIDPRKTNRSRKAGRSVTSPNLFRICFGLSLALIATPILLATDTPNIAWVGGGQYGQTSVAVSPDGQFVATSAAFGDNTIKLWNRSDGRFIRTFTGDLDRVNSIAYSPDGQFIASAAK